jgi:hypothetical protein
VNSTTAIAIAGAAFAAGTFLSTSLLGETARFDKTAPFGERNGLSPPWVRSFARMALCLMSGLGGAFAIARGWSFIQLVVAGVMVCSLAGASYAGTGAGRRSNYAAVTSLVFVGVVSAFAADWSSLLAGVLAAVPFALGALLFPRPAALTDILFSALAGLSLGLLPAVFVLFVAAAAVMGFLRLRPATKAKAVAFAPFIAGANFVAVIVVIVVSA